MALTEQEKAQRLGAELTRYMKDNGFTKKYLLLKLGCSRPTLSDWMDGIVYPNFRNRHVIASALGLTIDELHQKIGESSDLPLRSLDEVIQTIRHCPMDEFLKIHAAVADRAGRELEQRQSELILQSQSV